MIKEWMLHVSICFAGSACVYFLVELLLVAHTYMEREKLAGIIRALLYVMVQFVEFLTMNRYRQIQRKIQENTTERQRRARRCS